MDKKLPFLATLRNLRNLLLARSSVGGQVGIAPALHETVLQTLKDERVIARSRVMPSQFFCAFDVLDALKTMAAQPFKAFLKQRDEAKKAFEDFSAHVNKGPLHVQGKLDMLKNAARERLAKCNLRIAVRRKLSKIPSQLFEEYASALSLAVEIAAVKNVQPIHGRTLILLDIRRDSDLYTALSQSRSGHISSLTKVHVALLLCFMCEYCCEESDIVGFDNDAGIVVQFDTHRLTKRGVNLLDKVRMIYEALQRNHVSKSNGSAHISCPSTDEVVGTIRSESLHEYLSSVCVRRVFYSAVIAFTDNFWDEESVAQTESPRLRFEFESVTMFKRFYRACVNSELLFICVNAAARTMPRIDCSDAEQIESMIYEEDVVFDSDVEHDNDDILECDIFKHVGITSPEQDKDVPQELDLLLAGVSEKILRFLARGGGSAQLRYIDNLDSVKGIKTESVLPGTLFSRTVGTTVQDSPSRVFVTPNHARLFVSSPFLDFHNERDVLASRVMPVVNRTLARNGISASVSRILSCNFELLLFSFCLYAITLRFNSTKHHIAAGRLALGHHVVQIMEVDCLKALSRRDRSKSTVFHWTIRREIGFISIQTGLSRNTFTPSTWSCIAQRTFYVSRVHSSAP